MSHVCSKILVRSETILQDVAILWKYRCFAAMAEARFPAVRKARWHNQWLIRQVRDTSEDTTKSYLDIKDLISKSMDQHPHRDIIRIHEGQVISGLSLHESLDACSKRTI